MVKKSRLFCVACYHAEGRSTLYIMQNDTTVSQFISQALWASPDARRSFLTEPPDGEEEISSVDASADLSRIHENMQKKERPCGVVMDTNKDRDQLLFCFS